MDSNFQFRARGIRVSISAPLQVQRERDSESRTRLRGSRQLQGLAVFFPKGAGVDSLGPIRQPTSRQGPEEI